MALADTVRAIVDDVAPLVGTGKVADYIPALARVPLERFGIVVRTVDGCCITAGDADERFSIQSVSKVLRLTLALESRAEALWLRRTHRLERVLMAGTMRGPRDGDRRPRTRRAVRATPRSGGGDTA